MNTIDSKSRNVSFGIAFRTYTNNRGVKTADLIDIAEELKMYKNIEKKMQTDKFIKTKLGIQSPTMRLEHDDYVPSSTAMRYYDETGEYFFADNNSNLRGVGDAFRNLRNNLVKMIMK